MATFLGVVRVHDPLDGSVSDEHYREVAPDFPAAVGIFVAKVAALNAFDREHYGDKADVHVLHAVEVLEAVPVPGAALGLH